MTDRNDNPLRHFQAEGLSTHRRRLLCLDKNDHALNGERQPSKNLPNPIPIPGAPEPRTSSNYSYGDTFRPGRVLGMRRRPDQDRDGSTRKLQSETQRLGSGSSEPKGKNVPVVRRTYKVDTPTESGRRSNRSSRRSDAGFLGTRPLFRTPLTPDTHDNSTGKGRLIPAGNDRSVSSYMNGRHRPEPETIDLSPTRTSSASSKRQKTRHDPFKAPRRHIKIAQDDEVPDPDPPRTTYHNNIPITTPGNSSPGVIEPIEIDSDEANDALSDVFISPEQHVHNITNISQPAESKYSLPSLSNVPTRHHPSTTRQASKSTQGQRAILENETLNYPDSDQESQSAATDKSTRLTEGNLMIDLRNSLHSTLRSKVSKGTSPHVSPYFANNRYLPHGTKKRVKNEGSSSEDDDTPVKVVQSMMQKNVGSPRSTIDTDILEYNFHIKGLGGPTQLHTRGWAMRVSDQGFKFYNADKKLDLRSEILNENIVDWITEDSTHVIHILVENPVAKISGGKQIFVTLETDEGPRFIQMLQNRSSSHGIYRKYTFAADMRRIACLTSYNQLVRPDKSSLDAHDDSFTNLASTAKSALRSPQPESSPVHVPRAELGTFTEQRLPFSGRSPAQVYDAAIGPARKANPIPLPRGRDQNKASDERHLLVDSAEVKPHSDNAPGNMDADFMLDTVPARRVTRGAEQRAISNSKTSEPLLIYPNTKGQNSVTLYEEDLERLRPDEFLNDSIVEFYLRYNYDNLNVEQRASAHVFNTFFYQRLTQKRDKEANYEAVRRWTSKGKGVDLFSKKFVVIPINENLHWYLAVVVNLDNVIFGEDVTRAQDVSYIQADNEFELDTTIDAESSIPIEAPFDTRNILDDLGFNSPHKNLNGDEAMQAPAESQPSHADGDGVSGADNVHGRISESPTAQSPKEDEEILDFNDDVQPVQDQANLSLTEKIRASEKARQTKSGGGTAVSAAIVDTNALDNLSLDDSQSEPSQTISNPGLRTTKKGKTKKPLSGYSKPGRHIANGTPTIIILDSLNNNHIKVYDIIKDYLVREAQDKKKLVLSSKQFATSKADLPKQDNYSDCGLFLIQYADTLLKEPNVVTQLLEKVKYNNPAALQAHKRAFKNMFEIDRIPLRRKEMIEQIRALSIPFREQSRQQERLKKHERAVALQEKKSTASNSESAELEQENSCSLLSTDPMKEQTKDSTPTPTHAQLPQPPSPLPAKSTSRHDTNERIIQDSQEASEPDSEPPQNKLHNFATKVANEDSIDELNCL